MLNVLVTGDDIATAAGISKLNNVPNYAWAVSISFFYIFQLEKNNP